MNSKDDKHMHRIARVKKLHASVSKRTIAA